MKMLNTKQVWWSGSSGRVPSALRSNPSSTKKKKTEKLVFEMSVFLLLLL
jgi:hypothetical protein